MALSSSLRRLGDQPYVGVHLENVSRLFLRVIAIIISISAIFSVFELPASYFIGSSAFIGAVIGFGSSQTINNIAAGFFVVFSRPFIVMDYVKIGDYEGQVEEYPFQLKGSFSIAEIEAMLICQVNDRGSMRG